VKSGGVRGRGGSERGTWGRERFGKQCTVGILRSITKARRRRETTSGRSEGWNLVVVPVFITVGGAWDRNGGIERGGGPTHTWASNRDQKTDLGKDLQGRMRRKASSKVRGTEAKNWGITGYKTGSCQGEADSKGASPAFDDQSSEIWGLGARSLWEKRTAPIAYGNVTRAPSTFPSGGANRAHEINWKRRETQSQRRGNGQQEEPGMQGGYPSRCARPEIKRAGRISTDVATQIRTRLSGKQEIV